MRAFALGLMLISLPASGFAAGYCQLEAAAAAGLPKALAGTWQGQVVTGMAIDGGKPQPLPGGGAAKPAKLSAEGAGLVFSDASMEKGLRFEPVRDAASWDYALPGESPLLADELLAPLLEAAKIDCAAQDLPVFLGAMPLPQQLRLSFHAFVTSDQTMILVMQVGPSAPVAAAKARAVRVVLAYQR